ncbi:MAG: 16S rRNA (uracil(1498)-N(3))-methyltransferase [Deltaproteobacteria bacterium]|nr:16S rRNA (uracil(1498)-N(3))-methyltransferase [Deltaproteobacteria bacterium]MBW2661683.1 16S rRNA (uracil(1498)-N(3))-methyltransferase [Deltaproteobacteria bacterium]
MRYFHINQSGITDSKSIITGTDAKHIKKVLRLKLGDVIGLFDGLGFEYEAEIIHLSTNIVEVLIIHRFPSKTESPVQIIVAQAFLKDRKMDTLVRQLSELGITKWIPFIARRSIPRPDKKRLAARRERWEKIAAEAPKQCKRNRIAEIGATVSFKDMLKAVKDCDLKIVFYEDETTSINSILTKHDRHISTICIMIGPEGGFTSQEIENARNCGFLISALGPRVLKAETATITASALIQYLFGDLGLNIS